MNPRLFCRERSFHKAILLTYSFDPVFFEQVVLSDLWAGRASDILVIGDGRQINESMQSAAGQLWHLGKRYLLANVDHTGSFHPKVLLRLGPTEGAVMVGSGNLTSCGWGANKEMSCAWMVGPEHPDNGAWLLPFLDDVISWCVNDLERDAVRRMKDVAWLGLAAPERSTTNPLIYSHQNRALASTLAERWQGRNFTEVFIFTGSTDESGAFLRWAHGTFGIKRAVIALTLSQASFSLAGLADLPIELRLIPAPYKSPLHAKFYFFDGPDGAAAVMGSPNCSAAAWLLSPDNGGNVETALVYDTAWKEAFMEVLEIFDLPSMNPEEVLERIDSNTTQKDASDSPYDLIGLRWDAGSKRILGIISPQPEAGTSVGLLLGNDQIPMRSVSLDSLNYWVCDVPDGIEFISAEFASVSLERGGDQWITGIRWIDHLAELHHSSQTARFLEPIKGLENGGSLSEQRRILEDIHQVAQALFSDSGAFRDSGFGIAQEPQESPDVPAPPVDPAALIRNLEDSPESVALSGQGAPGSLSLSGILRLLFDAERTVAGNDAAANDEKLDEGPPDNPIAKQTVKEEAAKDEIKQPVDVKLQSRLVAQIEVFIENLSKPEFASTCTASQMVQAVCFPLAVALRGQARAWVSSNDAERWAIAVVALLFRGKTSNSLGLLRAVEQRYIEKGQSVLFQEVVGDGTLWMVLIASLGNSTWIGVGAYLDKALALREVFKAPQLISSAQASRVGGLLGQLRIEKARTYVSIVAPAVSALMNRLEERIRPMWKLEASKQVERQLVHRFGDLLWRDNVGWAICLKESSHGDKIEVRLRGEPTKIGTGFYLNVSDLANRDNDLSTLLVDLRGGLEPHADALPQLE